MNHIALLNVAVDAVQLSRSFSWLVFYQKKTVWVYILHFTAPPRLGRGKMTEPVENKRGKNKI